MQLPNKCSTSEFKVSPANWDKRGASTDVDWVIYYTFYDPEYPKPLRRQIRGMNGEKNLKERRLLIKTIIAAEIKDLQEGFNPIRSTKIAPVNSAFDITRDTPFIEALWTAKEKIKGVNGTLIDIGCTIRGIEKSAKQLGFDKLRIGEISQKHYVVLFEQCYKNNKRFSPTRQNKYVAWLRKLYKVLKKMEAVESNPLLEFEKEETVVKKRRMPTKEERELINKTLFKNHYTFWRALQLFHASGARETEFMALQGKDVNQFTHYTRYTVKKGKTRNVERPIKDRVWYLWEEILNECESPEDYLFSRFLKPGPKKIRTDQLGRRWTKYVKAPVKDGGLAIDVDLYALKYINATESMDELDRLYGSYDPAEDVKDLTGHTTTAMIASIYDTKYEKRKHEKLKRLTNSF